MNNFLALYLNNVHYGNEIFSKTMFLGIPVSTTGDILNLSLAGGFLILILVLVIVLLRIHRILGNINEITENVAEISDIIRHYLWKPVVMINKIVQKIKSLFSKKK